MAWCQKLVLLVVFFTKCASFLLQFNKTPRENFEIYIYISLYLVFVLRPSKAPFLTMSRITITELLHHCHCLQLDARKNPRRI